MTAVILLGHGSRAPGAGRGIERAAASLATRNPNWRVRFAHLQVCHPNLRSVLESLATQGPSRVVVLPFFLHSDDCTLADIPAQLEELYPVFPELRIALLEHLGYDERIVEIIEQRCLAATSNVFEAEAS